MENNKIYKSLFEVKDKYFPNADLNFLEGSEDDISTEEFMQLQKKRAKKPSTQPVKEVEREVA